MIKTLFNYEQIRVHIAFAFMVLTTITVLIIVNYSYHQNTKNVLALTEKFFTKTSKASIQKLENFFQDVDDAGSMVTNYIEKNPAFIKDPNILYLFASVMKINKQILAVYVGNQEEQVFQLRRIFNNTPYRNKEMGVIPESVYFAQRYIEPTPLPNGNEKWFYLDSSLNMITQESSDKASLIPTKRDWYHDAELSGDKVWSKDIYTFITNGKSGITFSMPFKEKSGKILGVLGIDLTIDSLNSYLHSLKITKDSQLYLLNSNGQILGTSEMIPSSQTVLSLQTYDNPLLKKCIYDLLQRNFSYGMVQYAGENYVVYNKSFQELNNTFQLVMIAPERDFIGDFRETQKKEFIISLLVMVLSLVILDSLSKRISTPIGQLCEESRKIADLDLDSPIDVHSGIYEIKLLSDTMKMMQKSIKTFSIYVPKNLVNKLAKKSGEITLGGSIQKLTILFSDIASFTTISENLPAEYLMLHMSEYFEEMTTVLTNHSGTIDKYIGDSIMAFWGAPDSDEHQVMNACLGALECQKKLQTLNTGWAKVGKPKLPTRMGIHTGEAVVGNVGCKERMNYTAIGDSVNLASRLEGTNKMYGTMILVSQSVVDAVQGQFLFRQLDKVAVKGKNYGINIFELLDINAKTIEDYDRKNLVCHDAQEAFNYYLEQRWDKAIKIYKNLLTLYPEGKIATEILLERCLNFKKTPPLEPWDGVDHLKQK